MRARPLAVLLCLWCGAAAAQPPDPAKPSADPAAARLAFARAELAAAGEENPLPQAGPVVVAYERAAVHAARRGRATVRVLAGVVRVQNADPRRTATVGPGVVLRAGGRMLEPNRVPDGISPRREYARGTAADWEAARAVPPGQTREFPASFFDFPGGPDALPDPLVLVVPVMLAPAAPTEGGAAPTEGGAEEGRNGWPRERRNRCCF